MTRRIDAHQHFWRYSPNTHGWIDDSMQSLRCDFLPADLEPLLRAANFSGCIAVQAQQDTRETEWLLALAAEHSFILGVVGWVDLCSDDVHADLERLAVHPKLKGIRHIVQSEPDARFMLRPEFMRGIAALSEFGLTYDILVFPRQISAAAELAAAFPDQRFVLDHIGKPEIRERRLEPWASDIAALAANKNVWCKLSGMVTEAEWTGWTRETFGPYVDVIFRSFGPDRVMIGSDWPVCTLAGSYDDVVELATTEIARAAPGCEPTILGENAAAFYRL